VVWDKDARGFMIPIKVHEKYVAFLSFRLVEDKVGLTLKVYPKRMLKFGNYSGKIVFESIINIDEFKAFIKALESIGSLLVNDVPSLVNELDRVILHLNWLRNLVRGGGFER
jgi:AAA+ ATPase superfamily predicted ATPase